MILIDDAPLRKRTVSECTRAMAKFEKARAEWRQFETEDCPAYKSWLARMFGPLLTELRENDRLLREQRMLLREVNMERIWGPSHDPRKAYAEVMKRRESPEPEEELDSQAGESGFEEFEGDSHGGNSPEGSEGGERDGGESERHAQFNGIFFNLFGFDPRQMPGEDYRRLFQAWEAGKFSEASSFEFEEDSYDEWGFGGEPSSQNADARIKEIYRILVRRLHPDLRTDKGAPVSSIWHDIQEAYAARDLERLEMLLALTEMVDGRSSSMSTLGQMREAVAELKRSLRAVQSSIREARTHPAWKFTQTMDLDSLEEVIRRDFTESVREQRRELREIKRTLDEWSKPHERKRPASQAARPPAPARSKKKAPSIDPFQTEFGEF